MRIDYLRARIIADLREIADRLEGHPNPDYRELRSELLAFRKRLREYGNVEVKEDS